MYQILIKVPVTTRDEDGNPIGQEYSDPVEVFEQASQIKPDMPEVGQIHINNSQFSCFGWQQETNDISILVGLPEDVGIIVSEKIIE